MSHKDRAQELALYRAAQDATDSVLGPGTYAQMNGFDPSQGQIHGLAPDWANQFAEAIKGLNQVRKDCTIAASGVAGCDLSEWDIEDIMTYIDLGIAAYGHQMGYWDWQKTAR